MLTNLFCVFFSLFVFFQSSFSQLHYIPESQPLFEKGDSLASESVVSEKDGTTSGAAIGEGLAAVRALYATSAAGPSTEVPFLQTSQKEELEVVVEAAAQDAPKVKVDLLGTLEAEAGATAPPPTSTQAAEAGAVAGSAGDVWVQCYDEESGWPYVYNEATGEMKWVEPESTEQLLAVMWEICYDEDGNEFYYNQVNCWCCPTSFMRNLTSLKKCVGDW